MIQTSIVNLRDNDDLTETDREVMGVDDQVMLVRTLSYLNASGALIAQDSVEFYNTVAEAEAARLGE